MRDLDLENINNATDLLRLCGGSLKKVAGSDGGEWAGPCPICGGTDRFHIQPYHRKRSQPQPRWLCRKCSEGSWRGPLDFVMASRGLSFGQAVRWLKEFNFPASNPVPRMEVRKREIVNPSNTWQDDAAKAINRACEALWASASAKDALSWLERRGLSDPTLDYFLIGWSDGIQNGTVYLPRGVVIPCMEGERVWYIKIALLEGQPVRCETCGQKTAARRPCPHCGKLNKYRGVKGSRGGAIFNCDELTLPGPQDQMRDVLFVEGEFDCMIAWQALRDKIAVVTLGSASGRLNLAHWSDRLMHIRRIYTLYDNDPAGERDRQALDELTGGAAHHLSLPQGIKDVNEFVLKGGNLDEWFRCQLNVER